MDLILYDIVTCRMKKIIGVIEFILIIFINIVYIYNNSSWIEIHVYVFEKWKQLTLLLILEKITTNFIV
jgi:hypothetical protein